MHIYVRTYKMYGSWKMHGQILGIVIGYRYLQILDNARFLKLIRQIWCHIQHVLKRKSKLLKMLDLMGFIEPTLMLYFCKAFESQLWEALPRKRPGIISTGASLKL